MVLFVAALITCFCLVLFLFGIFSNFFGLLFLARVASQSYYTLQELLHHPTRNSP